MRKTAVICTITLLFFLIGITGAVSAAEISVQIPDTPLTVGQTAKIPVVITGADRLTSLTLQIGSSSAADFDPDEEPLGGMYIINSENGMLVWISITPLSGDLVVTNLVVTPTTNENVPIEINLREATVRPSSPDENSVITDSVQITKNIIIPVEGALTTATISPARLPISESPTTAATTQSPVGIIPIAGLLCTLGAAALLRREH
ncbi:hypothetical protein McpSp1_08160 [Methanocorpusculaceae archaeon Sp1]|nr:hypothetical protein [Methanocorpusculaceae archaeon Sp1]